MEMVRKSDPRDGWYRISPASAEELLKDAWTNRPVSLNRAEAIALCIKDKKWQENGETIVLDDKGRLMDGQHRMEAVILAGRSVVSYVVHLRHTSMTTFNSFDKGWVRTLADALTIRGVKHAALTVAMLRLVMTYEEGLRPGAGGGKMRFATAVGVNEIVQRYEADADNISAAVAAIAKMNKLLRGLSPTSVASFALYMASKKSPDKAAAFVNAVATGENLASSNPAMRLRNRLIANATSRAKFKVVDHVALWIQAWNAYYKGDQLGVSRYRPEDAFPKFAA